jgi:hypothetical protein
MKKILMLGAMIAVFGLGTAAALAATSDKPPSPPGQSGNEQVCPEGNSGKIDVSGNNASITVTAPEGMLISGYCVKAGSANEELGPEFHTVDPPAETVTITHSSGKDISHYSLTFVAETPPTETTPDTTTTETTSTETTSTETTSTETTSTETTPTETTRTETIPTETTVTETTPAETTPAETTPAETTPTPQVFTPPTAEKPAKGPSAPVAGVKPAVTRPTTAAQAAPFTP